MGRRSRQAKTPALTESQSLRKNRRLTKNRGFTAGTLQEDLKLSSEEVRDDEHLRYSVEAFYIIAPHNPNCTQVAHDFQGVFDAPLMRCGIYQPATIICNTLCDTFITTFS